LAPRRKRDPVNHNVSVRFREAEFKVVEEIALSEDVSMGGWIRKQVLRALAKKGKTVPVTNGAGEIEST
jgi:hypothetical protein